MQRVSWQQAGAGGERVLGGLGARPGRCPCEWARAWAGGGDPTWLPGGSGWALGLELAVPSLSRGLGEDPAPCAGSSGLHGVWPGLSFPGRARGTGLLCRVLVEAVLSLEPLAQSRGDGEGSELGLGQRRVNPAVAPDPPRGVQSWPRVWLWGCNEVTDSTSFLVLPRRAEGGRELRDGSKWPVIDQFSLSVRAGPGQRSGGDSPGGRSRCAHGPLTGGCLLPRRWERAPVRQLAPSPHLGVPVAVPSVPVCGPASSRSRVLSPASSCVCV